MENKRLASIVICGLLLTTVGCQDKVQQPPAPAPATPPTRSIAVQPGLGVYNYAHIGDVLEFTALDPNTSPFWVIFEDPSPCTEKFVMVTKDKPGQCKVTAQLKVYYYTLSKTPPPAVPIPTPPVEHPTAAAPRKCPQCQVMLIGPLPTSPSGPPSTTPSSPTLHSEVLSAPKTATAANAIPNAIPEQVECDSTGMTTVQPITQYQNDRIFWYYGSLSNVAVTVPAGCSDDNNNPMTTFNTIEDVCKLTGTPKTYSYTVKAPACAKPGTATFTIVAPPKNRP
jgi:hypothetical protein